MVARTLRFFLLAELLLYLLIAGGLQRYAEWSGWATFILAIVMAGAGRALIISATYLALFTYREPLAAAETVGPLRLFGEALREVVNFFLLLSLVQPFDRAFLPADSEPRDDRPTLLLVHGYQCNRAFWWWLAPRLERAGFNVATISLEPIHTSIDTHADALKARVDRFRQDAGNRLILVGHSMGGLVARAYLARHGDQQVAGLITIGTPHHGSQLAHLGFGQNARQMEPGNPWLESLARTSVSVPCTAIYSPHDNYVVPPASAKLAGARLVALPGLGHLSMSTSARVLAAIEEAAKNLPKAA